MAHSGAARAGVDNLVKSLAIEWTPSSGIRINSVSPGTIMGSGMQNYPSEFIDQVVEHTSWQNPSARLGTESEVSATVCFLLSPAASYINGVCLRVDGGSSLVNAGPAFASVTESFQKNSHVPAYYGYDSLDKTNCPSKIKVILNKYIEKSKL